jgi:S1-C subfamily serine protease
MPAMVTAADRAELSARDIFRLVAPSVYLVIATTSAEALGQGKGSLGSAVAIARDIAITNCHVVQGQNLITLYDESFERLMAAKIFKADIKTDRCVLRTQGGLRPVASIRTSSELAVGERVYTIGNPSGLSKTLGEGLISGLRKPKSIELIQTTAQISKGSSGGALVDSTGALIGITTFLLRDAQNLNFAIAAQEFWRQ